MHLSITEIRANIALVNEFIASIDLATQALYSAGNDELAATWYVVGFNDGTAFDAKGNVRGAQHAKLYQTEGEAIAADVRGRHGEWPAVKTYGEAIDEALRLQWAKHDSACGLLQALYGELVEAQDRAEDAAIAEQIERDEMEAAWLDAQADAEWLEWLEMEAAKEAYEREHRRHGSWSLRRAATIIANSQTEYEG